MPAIDSNAEKGAACGPGSGASTTGSVAASSRPRGLRWAELLRRVFADDVLQCACGGRRSVIAIATDPALAETLLTALGMSSEPVVTQIAVGDQNMQPRAGAPSITQLPATTRPASGTPNFTAAAQHCVSR